MIAHLPGCTGGRIWITREVHTYCPCVYGRLVKVQPKAPQPITIATPEKP